MKTKLNYSAEQMMFVYRKVKEEQTKALKNITLPIKYAFGGWYFQIDDVFNETGEEPLRYNYVGYGGVNFLGNINGKGANRLFYKTSKIKKEIETLIITMQSISDDSGEAIITIKEQHGEPHPQACILWHEA